MRVLVTGDRHWANRARLFATLDLLPVDTVIEGCARGADRMAGDHDNGWARLRGVPSEHYPADWPRYRGGAGPKRNTQMLGARPDLVVAFHDDLAASKGTANMVRQALAAGVPVRLFTSRGEALLPPLRPWP